MSTPRDAAAVILPRIMPATTMSNTRLLLVPIVSSLLLPAAARPQTRTGGTSRTRLAFVGVTEAGGAPVLDLGAPDFRVTESGVKREIVRAELARTPMRIALMIDTSDAAAPALNHLRAGLLAFLDALQPEHEILIVTTGRQARVRLQPTTDRKKARDSAAGIFPDGGATPLMDALLDIDERFLRKATNRWPVLVVVTADGAESSSPANEKKFNDWIVALPGRGMSAHAFALKYRGGGTPEIVAAHVAQSAGGRFDFMNTSNSLPEKLKELGARLAADYTAMTTRYEVEFQTDSTDMKPIDVAVARAGVRLQMSYRRAP
jgi:Mg-chelatase subunit ChlD